ncbi:MAG: Spo0E family sporulation regulatory protein-aspartic acid phosphatase [Limnochordia bacterium]
MEDLSFLQEEINLLREQLEQAYKQDNRTTSRVLEIAQRLDHCILQYMRLSQGRSSD